MEHLAESSHDDPEDLKQANLVRSMAEALRIRIPTNGDTVQRAFVFKANWSIYKRSL